MEYSINQLIQIIWRKNMSDNNPTSNPFEFLQSFMNQENFAKMAKWMPNVNVSSLNNIFKETADAINSTNQLVSESFQSIAKKSADSFQKNTSEMFNTMKEAISSGDMEQVNDCQHQYVKLATQNNIDNAKEMLDITLNSAKEVLEVLGKNFTENIIKSFKNEGKNFTENVAETFKKEGNSFTENMANTFKKNVNNLNDAVASTLKKTGIN